MRTDNAAHAARGAGHDVGGRKLAHRGGSSGASVNRGLYCGHIAPNHDGNERGANVFVADKINICGFEHAVRAVNGRNHAKSFNQAKGFFTCILHTTHLVGTRVRVRA